MLTNTTSIEGNAGTDWQDEVFGSNPVVNM